MRALAVPHDSVSSAGGPASSVADRTPEEVKADNALAERLSAIIEDANERLIPLCNMIRKNIESFERQKEEDRDEAELVKQVRPLIEQVERVLNETNGAVKGADPGNRLSNKAKRNMQDHKATPEEQRLAEALKTLLQEVQGTIDWAKDKLDSFPKAKKDLGPLLDALGQPLTQIVGGVGLLLAGVLNLLGKLLSGLGLDSLLKGIISATEVDRLMGSLVLRANLQRRLQAAILCHTKCCARARLNATLSVARPPLETTEAGPSTVEEHNTFEIPFGRSLLDQTKVEEHLSAIQAAQEAPLDLKDLEYYRPKGPCDPNSVQYEHQYKNLLDGLLHSFSKKQLRRCCQLYGMDAKSTAASRTKKEYARAIVEKEWGWPSLHQVRQKQQAWVQETRSFPLNPRQSFLILGKDGSDLLSLSAKYDVHMSLSSNPLSLNASGRRGSLEKLTERINSITSNVQENIFDLPSRTPLSSNLLQRISRLTGAFVENFGRPGTIRISALDERALAIARRLALRTSQEARAPQEESLLAYIPPTPPSETPSPISFPYAYSVYPFLASRPLPWSIITNGLFLSDGNLTTLTGESVDIKSVLSDSRPALSNGEPAPVKITASLGHLLVPSSTAGRANILPPLKGSWQFSKILDWWRNHSVQPAFVPSRPDAVFTASQGEQKVLHRLVYHSFDPTQRSSDTQCQKVIKFEVLLKEHETTGEAETHLSSSTPMAQPSEELALSAELEDVEGPQANDDPAATSVRREIILDPECIIGEEKVVNVMIPDRPMDMQLTVSHPTVLASDKWPAPLQQYFASLRDFLTLKDPSIVQPDSPLTLFFEGHNYLLRSTSSVRQTPEYLSQTESVDDISVLTEQILDLESDQQSTICKIVAHTMSVDTTWNAFLTACDRLTANKKDLP
ncbi:hypothetical protein EYR36_007328 [Pleurotus pulmonarius]|nr:hypothetical protein EYR36_007328 [Pleurotus pulmonarius]